MIEAVEACENFTGKIQISFPQLDNSSAKKFFVEIPHFMFNVSLL